MWRSRIQLFFWRKVNKYDWLLIIRLTFNEGSGFGGSKTQIIFILWGHISWRVNNASFINSSNRIWSYGLIYCTQLQLSDQQENWFRYFYHSAIKLHCRWPSVTHGITFHASVRLRCEHLRSCLSLLHQTRWGCCIERLLGRKPHESHGVRVSYIYSVRLEEKSHSVGYYNTNMKLGNIKEILFLFLTGTAYFIFSSLFD